MVQMLYTSQHRMTINQAENNEPDNKQHTHNSIMLYNIMPYGKEERWLLLLVNCLKASREYL